MVPDWSGQEADGLGDLGYCHLFAAIDGAGEHDSVGAILLKNQVMLDWFQDVI